MPPVAAATQFEAGNPLQPIEVRTMCWIRVCPDGGRRLPMRRLM